MSKALVKDVVHMLCRRNPTTGYLERIHFVGSLRHKPNGWKVDTAVKPSRAMEAEQGLV